MPLFMDFHKIENITIDEVLQAHMVDIPIQEKYGVKYHQFWVNQKEGTVFCLTEGPDAKTCELVHQMSHGNIACAITEVEPGSMKLFMGDKNQVDHGLVKTEDGRIDLGYRSVMIASIRGITSANHSQDLHLLRIPHWAKQNVIENLIKFQGREVKWETDDCIIGVFNECAAAVECALQIQASLKSNGHDAPIMFKIGISADQPVTKNGEFFSKAIKLAHRLCTTAEDNQILVSALVKKLCQSMPATEGVKFLNTSDEDFVYSLLDITDQSLSNNDFTINNICKDIGISRPQFYRRIVSLTGRAPNYFLRDIRMEKALNLLKERSRNISQVALEVGYNNPSYFSKCFSDKFGCMPSDVLAAR